VILAAVFGIWFARERTLSIHSIVTLPRELFYWLAVLVTFALGTAVGDWTLATTGWGPGTSVLLPAGLIVAIVVGWRLRADAVLSFWLAYILTRPLGANLGDWLASPTADHGLGLGTALTSVIFLVAILVGVLLGWAAGQPHAASAGGEEAAPAPATAPQTPGQATAHFPPAEVANFRTITRDTLDLVRAGKQSEARTRIKDLETAWDRDQDTLQPLDRSGWTAVDGRIDSVLKALRSGQPDPQTESRTLDALLSTLG
jgi:repeat uncharacterized protein DUF347